MAREIEAVFHIVLLQEFLFSTVILGLTSYMVIVNVDAEDKGVLISCLGYATTVLVLAHGYCIAGEYLLIESTNLCNAYYECQWYTLSSSFKKQMLICMISAETPIQLTAGGFFVFSLHSFIGVLKSTAGYISMLRNIT